jgi:hypothetical protein
VRLTQIIEFQPEPITILLDTPLSSIPIKPVDLLRYMARGLRCVDTARVLLDQVVEAEQRVI